MTPERQKAVSAAFDQLNELAPKDRCIPTAGDVDGAAGGAGVGTASDVVRTALTLKLKGFP